MTETDKALAAAIPHTSLALLTASALYGLGDLLVPGDTELEVPYYFLAMWIPTATWLCQRFNVVSPRANILVGDVCWTLLVALGLGVAPHVTVSGTAFILSLKWLTSALFLPWPVSLQVFSSGIGLFLYFGTVYASADLQVAYVHQWALPPVAAVLSVIGCRILNRSREQARAHMQLVEQSERQLQSLVDLSPDGMLVAQSEVVVFANERVAHILGYLAPSDLVGMNLTHLARVAERQRLQQFLHRAATGSSPVPPLLLDLARRDGGLVPISLSAAPVAYRGNTSLQLTLRDMTVPQRNLILLEGERQVLEGIARGVELHQELASICQIIEKLSPSTRSSILITNLEGTQLFHSAAPSLPASYTDRVNGLAIADGNGTCGTCAFRREIIVTEDITQDPLWRDYQELARAHGLAACWSTPIVSASGDLLGTFAMYSGEPRRPTDEDLRLVQHATHLASIAIQRQRTEQRRSDEAELFSTLATVGRALISSLERSVLLQRLCEATRTALHADLSHVYLLDREHDILAAAAGSGDSPDQWEIVRTVTFPRQAMAVALEQLRQHESLEVSPNANTHLLPAGSQSFYGIHSGLFVELRNGDELLGILTAGYRRERAAFRDHQHRMLRGIAQLASLALENSRLMEELNGANRIKSNFVATMSHELRTPLNVLIGYQDLLLDEEFGPLTAAQHDIVRRLGFHARQLLLLVNDTLDLSRLESGKMEIHSELISLTLFVERLRRETEEAWGHRGLTLRFQVEGAPTLRSDAAKLHVILRSLIANAVKFTQEGTVNVSARSSGNAVEIVVEDTGIGIPPDAVDIIFEPFTQAAPTISNRFGGAGLGLHIVKRLLDLLGGTISVTSTLGAGSTFHVIVPNQVEPAAEGPSVNASSAIKAASAAFGIGASLPDDPDQS